ncbi:SulA-like leucine-rich domain-containing protein [Gallaecimonas sp. GXIMD4217]|uniref:SulA-like leucine-rich domain-containing protein n=1 Tax=Gallaecimonas sp. GXIMD4217 TaxID=3131927 RepID=UPI00311AFD7B
MEARHLATAAQQACLQQLEPGQTEQWQQLLPRLRELSQERRWILMLAPPAVPSRDQWLAWGVDPARVLVVHGTRVKNALHTLAKALANGNFSAVLSWRGRFGRAQLQLLRKAASKGGSQALLFKTGQPAPEPVIFQQIRAVRVPLPRHARAAEPSQEQGAGLILKGPWPH